MKPSSGLSAAPAASVKASRLWQSEQNPLFFAGFPCYGAGAESCSEPSSSARSLQTKEAAPSGRRAFLVCKKSICCGKIMSQELQSSITVIFANHFNSKVCHNLIPGECDSGERREQSSWWKSLGLSCGSGESVPLVCFPPRQRERLWW